jgi:phosphonate transport system substrate-binding protein
LAACSVQPAPTTTPQVETTTTAAGAFVLGKIGDDPAATIEEYQPIADCVATQLGNFGIDHGEVRVAQDSESMATLIDSGEVHVFFDNAFAVAQTMALSNGLPIVLRTKEGPASKAGVFFALPESGLTSLDDLKGQVITLQDPSDIIGYLGARVHMIEANLNPIEVESLASSVQPDQVGYIFSGDSQNTFAWVISGQTIAGVVEDDDFAEAIAQNPDLFVTLAKTEPLTRHQPGLAPRDLDPALAQAIVTSLTGLAGMCPDALSPSETAAFVPYSGEDKAAVERVFQMFQLMQED